MVVFIAFTLFLIATVAASPATAEDVLRDIQSEDGLRATIAPSPEDRAGVSYIGTVRAGYTSNSEADFQPEPGPLLVVEQKVEGKVPLGEIEAGFVLRGSLDLPTRASEPAYGDFEAALGGVRHVGDRLSLGLAAGYRAETDRGLTTDEVRGEFELKGAFGATSPFVTATVNHLTHRPIEISGVSLDMTDADYLRLGLEAGVEVPLAAGLSVTPSAGLVEQRYFRGIDLAGIRRSSSSRFARLSIALTRERLEAKAGGMVFRRDYDDPTFPTTTLFLGDAEVSWQPREGTRMKLSYLADLEEALVYGVRDIRSDTLALIVAQNFGAGLTATAAAYWQRQAYLGAGAVETGAGARFKLAHRLSDISEIDLQLGYENTASNLIADSVEEWRITAGLTIAYDL